MPAPIESGDSPAFVGRAAELAVLLAALEDALGGRGRLVLIGGELGIGKSRLLEAFAAEARARGVPALFGQCDAMDGAPEYWPWTQMLRAGLAHTGHALPAGSPLTWLTGLARDGGAELPEHPTAGETTRFQQADAVVSLLTELSQRVPTALLIEDVHWADRGSLFLLAFLAARVARLPLVVVVTYRSEDVRPGNDLYAALAAITRAPAARHLVLRRLAADALRAYVAATSGVTPSDVAVAALARHTGGNPFFVTETVRWLLADVLPATKLGKALRKGLKLTVDTSVPGTLGGDLLVDGDRVASGSESLAAGTGAITFRFTKPARKRLARRKVVAIYADLTFTTESGAVVPVNGTVEVKR